MLDGVPQGLLSLACVMWLVDAEVPWLMGSWHGVCSCPSDIDMVCCKSGMQKIVLNRIVRAMRP